jgi:hypothetical protein
MKWRTALIGLLLAAAGSFLAAAPEEKGKAEGPRKGFVVHEWGVWRVHNDLELANADARQIWEGLPKFVYGQTATRELPKHWQNVEIVDRPVIFFHSPEAFHANLRIDFPTGTPGVWWPGTINPAVYERTVVADRHADQQFKALEWHLHIKQQQYTQRKPPEYTDVPERHWVRTLREVRADDVYAAVGERNFGLEKERFVYYDGLLPRGKWATIKVDTERVEVTNAAKHSLFDVTVIDRRAPDKPRVARLPQLNAGASFKLAPEEPGEAKWPDSGAKTLTSQLKEAGLYQDEAASLVTLWARDLFESEGVTVFYRLPQEEYERRLPLTLTPRPETLVRVGLVVHPYCEPGLAERVAQLVKELDDDDFSKREAAHKRLDAMGRAAYVHLLKLRDSIFAPEPKRRVEELLEKHDARRAISPK